MRTIPSQEAPPDGAPITSHLPRGHNKWQIPQPVLGEDPVKSEIPNSKSAIPNDCEASKIMEPSDIEDLNFEQILEETDGRRDRIGDGQAWERQGGLVGEEWSVP